MKMKQLLTAKDVNTLIRIASKRGRYIYAHTIDSIVIGTMYRIVQARTVNGNLQGKVLSSGKWENILNDIQEA
jgi:hypothetical protein